MRQMRYKELAELRADEDLRLIDVREPDEYEEVHVEDVELFPLSKLRRGERPDEDDRQVAMICRSGSRSEMAAKMLESEGWDEIINVSDGTKGAVEAGEEHVVRGS
jgi:rhodanese-related sulfurtransferase